MKNVVLVGALALLAGCGGPAPDAPPTVAAAEPHDEPSARATPAPSAATTLDPRDQYALMQEMLAAEAAPSDELAASFAQVRGAWEGHRFRWEMMRVDGLCTGPDHCLFAPFDLARFDHPNDAAFLPRVAFDAAGFEALAAACAPHAPTCVVTIEATLDELTFTVETPTTLTLGDARVVSARSLREGEYFLSRPPRAVTGSGVAVLRHALGARGDQGE